MGLIPLLGAWQSCSFGVLHVGLGLLALDRCFTSVAGSCPPLGCLAFAVPLWAFILLSVCLAGSVGSFRIVLPGDARFLSPGLNYDSFGALTGELLPLMVHVCSFQEPCLYLLFCWLPMACIVLVHAFSFSLGLGPSLPGAKLFDDSSFYVLPCWVDWFFLPDCRLTLGFSCTLTLPLSR